MNDREKIRLLGKTSRCLRTLYWICCSILRANFTSIVARRRLCVDKLNTLPGTGCPHTMDRLPSHSVRPSCRLCLTFCPCKHLQWRRKGDKWYDSVVSDFVGLLFILILYINISKYDFIFASVALALLKWSIRYCTASPSRALVLQVWVQALPIKSLRFMLK